MNAALLNYPRNSDDAAQTIIVGGLLILLSVLVIPTILLAGYLLRVLRRSARGESTPPRFDDWSGLLGDGVRGVLVSAVYSLVPLLGIAIVVTGVVTLGTDFAVVGFFALAVGGLVTICLALAALYVAPAALANVAEQRTFGAGFEWAAIRPVIETGEYAAAWLVALLAVLAGGALASLLTVVPFLGVVGGAFVVFYAAVVAYHVIGRAWGDGLGDALGVDPETAGDDAVRPVV